MTYFILIAGAFTITILVFLFRWSRLLARLLTLGTIQPAKRSVPDHPDPKQLAVKKGRLEEK